MQPTPKSLEPQAAEAKTKTKTKEALRIIIEEAGPDFCNNTKVMANGKKCPGCRACC